MARKEVHECDKCHKQATTTEEKELLGIGEVIVGFSLHHVGYGSLSRVEPYRAHQKWSKDLCRACRAEIGCLEEKIKEKDRANDNNVPTLEDMVREIVRQELPENQ